MEPLPSPTTALLLACGARIAGKEAPTAQPSVELTFVHNAATQAMQGALQDLPILTQEHFDVGGVHITVRPPLRM